MKIVKKPLAGQDGISPPPLSTLELGVKTLEVEYWKQGQLLMTDHLRFDQGSLLLVRRTVQDEIRVQYQDGEGRLVGVPWVKAGMAPGDLASATVQAGLYKRGEQSTQTVIFRTNALAANSEELLTPLKSYDSALKLVFTETPSHGAETRRIFVNEVGFVAFTARFALNDGAPATFYRLQKIRLYCS